MSKHTTQRYGIDTSVLVRLVTGEPREAFERCVNTLTRMVETAPHDIFASNQVIGETYVALQHHYGVNKADAREALRQVLTSGLVRPLEGDGVLDILGRKGGAGLLDRLIDATYADAGMVTLTLDNKMATLPNAERLR